MNLAIDIGNSLIKITIFRKNNKYKTLLLSKTSGLKSRLISHTKNRVFDSIIISCVREKIPQDILSLQKYANKFIHFSHQTPIPIKNCYGNPKKLGIDRLASAVGAFSLFPHKNCLIIDAGTAITIDLLNDKGEYLGGAISPGINTRFKSLADHTQKLPFLKLKNLNPYPGKNTIDSIQNGVQLGLIYEVEGYINEIGKYFPDLHVLVTGGDYDFFVRNIKKPIFAEPNLIAIGLYRILEHNA